MRRRTAYNFIKSVSLGWLAAGLILQTVLPAYADTTQIVEQGELSEASTLQPTLDRTEGTRVRISKDIKLYNTDGSEAYSPAVTYTYSVTPSSSVMASVTDSVGHMVQVKDGVEGAITTTGSVSFTSEIKTMAAEGSDLVSKVSQDLILSISPDTFGVPGVYRYRIQDTTDADTLAAAGIYRPVAYDTDRYLDVYVIYDYADADGDGSVADLHVSGCVLFRAIDGSNTEYGVGTSFVYSSSPTSTIKVSGYDIASEDADDGCGADEYHTYNVTLDTKITGLSGDRTNAWPFTITLSGTEANRFIVKSDVAHTIGSDGLTVVTDLKNEQALKIIGLPATAKIQINERNNTSVPYVISAADTTAASGTEVVTDLDLYIGETVSTQAQPGETIGTLVLPVTDGYVMDGSSNSPGSQITTKICFENKLDTITPGGVMLRVGPDFSMFSFSMMMLLVLAASKREEEDYIEDII